MENKKNVAWEKIICKIGCHLLESARLITFVGSNTIGSYLVGYRINLINGRKPDHRIFVKKFDDPQVELIRIIETKLDAAQKN